MNDLHWRARSVLANLSVCKMHKKFLCKLVCLYIEFASPVIYNEVTIPGRENKEDISIWNPSK